MFVAGHRGLVGSAVAGKLESQGYEVLTRTRQELDLGDQAMVRGFLGEHRPNAVIVAAAKVGGIFANSNLPADFISENIILEHNLIWGSHLADIPELVFIGSSCMYPRITPQPISEDAMLTGKLEPTNAPYAVAKIAGLTMCESIQQQYGRNYFTLIPPNLYGPGDNFDLANGHVLPSLLRKIHEAKEDGHRPVEIWGTGSPKREFLYVEDIAAACIFMLQLEQVVGFVNIGTGVSTSIRDLVEELRHIIGHKGDVIWNASMPDGFPEKVLDVSRAHSLGWSYQTTLSEGIAKTYDWYLGAVESGKVRCALH